MAMSENSGYDMILHKILRYNMVPKRSAVFKDQHSKINVLFSLTPSHASYAFERHQQSSMAFECCP